MNAVSTRAIVMGVGGSDDAVDAPKREGTAVSQVDPEVLDGVLEILRELSGDWEYDGEITPDTHFLADLGLESLDIVVLGTLIQQLYGRLPFAEYLEELGQRPIAERDVTVAELVAFVCEHRQPSLEEV